jgi:CheY-like chemotaxis protein
VIPETARPIQILLVEDSPGDVRLTQEVLRDAKIANELYVVGDGESAMAFLRQAGDYADHPRPDLVLLDLNLPRKDGREVLAELREDEDLHSIPVIVLTTSAAEQDILRSYQLSANAYITKPIDLNEFITVVRSIETFWLSILSLPPA